MSLYEVEFPNRTVLKYSMNVIVEKLHVLIDYEGHHQVVLEDIVGHTKSMFHFLLEAVAMGDVLTSYINAKESQTQVIYVGKILRWT